MIHSAGGRVETIRASCDLEPNGAVLAAGSSDKEATTCLK